MIFSLRELPIHDQIVNLQFCASILRIVDILDFDFERTPTTLFNSLGLYYKDLPTASVSLKEWKKHMAVHSILINDDELVISAHSNHPAIEKTIKEFASFIEFELRNTNAILQKNTADICQKYRILLPLSVRAKIESEGYVYKDYSLRLNEKKNNEFVNGGESIRKCCCGC